MKFVTINTYRYKKGSRQIMATTVGDIISKIEKYEKLNEKISISFDERVSNHFETNDDVLAFIKSKITYNDIIELQVLISHQIAMLKEVEVIEDDKNN